MKFDSKHLEIIIFGFSGSGKSTIAIKLGQELNLRVIHPSSILRNMCENKKLNISNTKHNTGFWESEKGVKIFNDRLKTDKPLDLEVDKILIREIEKENVIIDSWSLPWLTKKGVKIYLKTNVEVRAKRVSKRSHINYEKAIEIITMKDEKTRNLFKKHYDFDIKKDYEVFDLIIDTNKLNKSEVFNKIIAFLKEMRTKEKKRKKKQLSLNNI